MIVATSATLTHTAMLAMDTPEPHKERRHLIADKYPEVKKLFGPAPSLKWITLAETAAQL